MKRRKVWTLDIAARSTAARVRRCFSHVMRLTSEAPTRVATVRGPSYMRLALSEDPTEMVVGHPSLDLISVMNPTPSL